MPRRVSVDDLDRRILKLLCGDARMRNKDMAERIGLSESATAKRVVRLEEDGSILGYTAVLGGRDAIQADQLTRMRIGADKPALRLLFEDAVRQCDAILSAKRMVGACDYVLRGAGPGFISEVYDVAARSGVQIRDMSSAAIELEIKPLRGAPLAAFG